MSGRDRNAASLRFATAAKALMDRGWDVIVPPVDETHTEDDRRRVIRRDLQAVTELSPDRNDALVLLPGHELSGGGAAETATAKWFRLRTLTYDEAIDEGGDGPLELV